MSFFKDPFFNDIPSSFFNDPFFNSTPFPFAYDPYYRLYGGLGHPIANAIESMTLPPFLDEPEDHDDDEDEGEEDIFMDGIEGQNGDEGKEGEDRSLNGKRNGIDPHLSKSKDSSSSFSTKSLHRPQRLPSSHHGLIPYGRDWKMKGFTGFPGGDLFQPRMDITEEGDHYILQADLPGLTKEDVHIELTDHGILNISGERKWQYKTEYPLRSKSKSKSKSTSMPKFSQSNKEDQGKDSPSFSPTNHYTRIERSYGHFQRSIPLPNDIDRQSIEAKLENGVLHINLQKLKELPQKNNTKTITIQ